MLPKQHKKIFPLYYQKDVNVAVDIIYFENDSPISSFFSAISVKTTTTISTTTNETTSAGKLLDNKKPDIFN